MLGLLLSTAAATVSGFSISAKSGIIVDEESGKVLWEREADTPRYPASTTKIMTALLLLERCPPGEMVVAPKGVVHVKPSTMSLKPGEKVPAKDMLYALMLRSANDGAHAVAAHIGGTIPAFSKLMNERAVEIGCTNTRFNNPHGLNDPKHTSTARDLALIAREAMKYEAFREVVRTRRYEIRRSMNQKDKLMVSRNKWLFKDLSADGIKTGYTNPAGQCYVGSAVRDGYRVITVILKSENWQEDHRQMLDWAYANHEQQIVKRAGEAVGFAPVAGAAVEEIPAVLAQDIRNVVKRGRQPAYQIEARFKAKLEAPILQGQEVGEAIFRDDSGHEVTVALLAGVPAEKASVLAGAFNIGFGLTVGGLGIGAYLVKGRSRRTKPYARRKARGPGR